MINQSAINQTHGYWYGSNQNSLVNLLLLCRLPSISVSACIVEIFPSGKNKDTLLVKVQRLLSDLVVHLVCGCTVYQNMLGVVTVSVIKVFLHIYIELLLF